MEILVSFLIGVGLALFFVAGAAINPALETSCHIVKNKRTCVNTVVDNTKPVGPEEHRQAGYLISTQAASTTDLEIRGKMLSSAYAHFCIADILENGPYKI